MAQDILDKSGDILPHRPTAAGGGVTGSSDSSLTIAGSDAIINQAFAPTWTGAHIWNTADSGTTSVPVQVTAQHRNNAAGTPAAGYGIGIAMKLDSSARTLRSAIELDAVWSTATDGAEVSSLAIKTMLAGVLTETVRFGTGATLPDSDLSVSFGRAVMDSRTTDVAFWSHRDQTGTTSYALRHDAAGLTRLNCANGQTTSIMHAGTTRIQVNTTGCGFFGAAPVAQQALSGSRGGNAAVASIATALANLGLCTDGTTA